MTCTHNVLMVLSTPALIRCDCMFIVHFLEVTEISWLTLCESEGIHRVWVEPHAPSEKSGGDGGLQCQQEEGQHPGDGHELFLLRGQDWEAAGAKERWAPVISRALLCNNYCKVWCREHVGQGMLYMRSIANVDPLSSVSYICITIMCRSQ